MKAVHSENPIGEETKTMTAFNFFYFFDKFKYKPKFG